MWQADPKSYMGEQRANTQDNLAEVWGEFTLMHQKYTAIKTILLRHGHTIGSLE